MQSNRDSIFTRHLEQVSESYWEHFGHASSFALTLFGAALACLVHALVPWLFEKTGSRCIATLHDRMVVNRTRPDLWQQAAPNSTT